MISVKTIALPLSIVILAFSQNSNNRAYDQSEYIQDDIYSQEEPLNADVNYSEEAKETESDNLFNQILTQQNSMDNSISGEGVDSYSKAPAPASGSTNDSKSIVKMDLEDYRSLKQRIAQIENINEKKKGPAVILGSSSYNGKMVNGSLSLTLQLHATLGNKNEWKTVPIIGDDVILISATANGKQIPVSRSNKYHIWITNTDGEATIVAQILVPPRGPRGSIEYDFMAVRTPNTTFECIFPIDGLEPKLTAALQSESKKVTNGTIFSSTLRPTSRIHLIGFKEIGGSDIQNAKVYVETMNLLSVDEDALEMFSVFYYTILYSGTQKFNILIPKGLKIISADGDGAFRYNLEDTPDATLLTGETEFPIHNKFEISLRLRREIAKKGETFSVPLPRCSGVERESGWLGVEVPGKMRIEEKNIRSMLSIDMRQLPYEILQSSVSPILKSYRYHSSDAQVQVHAERLPEIEPSSGSIDNVRSVTKITNDGTTITEMLITLRNRLKHNLAITLPDNAEVISAMIDEEPLNISVDDQKKILLPMRRSIGDKNLEPFTITLTIKQSSKKVETLGFRSLQLPSIDLPIASLFWEVYLPGFNKYSRLWSDIGQQYFAGQVKWQQSSQNFYNDGSYSNDNNMAQSGSPETAGAMPVQFKVPLTGIRLSYSRYWLMQETPLKVSFFFVRNALMIPLSMLLSCIIAVLLLLSFFKSRTIRFRLISFTALVAVSLIGVKADGITTLAIGLIFGILILAIFYKMPLRIKDWMDRVFPKVSLKSLPTFRFSLKLFFPLLRYAAFGISLFILILLIRSLIVLIIRNPLPG